MKKQLKKNVLRNPNKLYMKTHVHYVEDKEGSNNNDVKSSYPTIFASRKWRVLDCIFYILFQMLHYYYQHI